MFMFTGKLLWHLHEKITKRAHLAPLGKVLTGALYKMLPELLRAQRPRGLSQMAHNSQTKNAAYSTAFFFLFFILLPPSPVTEQLYMHRAGK